MIIAWAMGDLKICQRKTKRERLGGGGRGVNGDDQEKKTKRRTRKYRTLRGDWVLR